MTIQAYQTLFESSIAFGMRKSLQAEQRTAEMHIKIEKLEEGEKLDKIVEKGVVEKGEKGEKKYIKKEFLETKKKFIEGNYDDENQTGIQHIKKSGHVKKDKN